MNLLMWVLLVLVGVNVVVRQPWVDWAAFAVAGVMIVLFRGLVWREQKAKRDEDDECRVSNF